MIHYTACITRLMRDLVARIPTLGFINVDEILVFARRGRPGATGAFATCHSLNLPPSEPGYYFWRDRTTGELTRRSQWFVTKSPRVELDGRRINYLISFALPRFCDQALDSSRKAEFYSGAEPWIAKLDTVVHELYHIDPDAGGIRRLEREDGTVSRQSHGPGFYQRVARMVREYLAKDPDPAVYGFLKYDFAGLQARFGEVVATTFRTFPSYPQRYIEVLADQPAVADEPPGVKIEPIRVRIQPRLYTERDLVIRRFGR